MSSKDVRAYRDSILAAGKTARTAKLSVKVLSAAFNAAIGERHTDKNPCLAARTEDDGPEEARELFTAEQLAKLVQATDGDWKSAILLGY